MRFFILALFLGSGAQAGCVIKPILKHEYEEQPEILAMWDKLCKTEPLCATTFGNYCVDEETGKEYIPHDAHADM